MEIISANTLEKMIQENADITIIDVRTDEEIAEGMIPNAKHHNVFSPDFMSEIEAYDPNKAYVMICRSGARSGQACMQMMGAGFQKIYNLEGGMMGWSGETV
ncbi:rhodanese-like domain-containing protein [Putridiphycobacter roseus]|uniref:Rhodanese-like domain-containing protein n=1 Tax=Putridiphycobacter roseus TaxID=2219161 RepID=A0A2W1MWF0_9FLAO|nr:rhodanese-like domain-containing protein [Putridiphycobacter roseus]PZE16439.1 rhodanese-like domain-containing protein [Putridiphycobacter roseus]